MPIEMTFTPCADGIIICSTCVGAGRPEHPRDQWP
jgi:hypothetical protein